MADKNGKERSLDRKSHCHSAKTIYKVLLEESEEELDTGKSLSGEDSDSLTENEECGG